MGVGRRRGLWGPEDRRDPTSLRVGSYRLRVPGLLDGGEGIVTGRGHSGRGRVGRGYMDPDPNRLLFMTDEFR